MGGPTQSVPSIWTQVALCFCSRSTCTQYWPPAKTYKTKQSRFRSFLPHPHPNAPPSSFPRDHGSTPLALLPPIRLLGHILGSNLVFHSHYPSDRCLSHQSTARAKSCRYKWRGCKSSCAQTFRGPVESRQSRTKLPSTWR